MGIGGTALCAYPIPGILPRMPSLIPIAAQHAHTSSGEKSKLHLKKNYSCSALVKPVVNIPAVEFMTKTFQHFKQRARQRSAAGSSPLCWSALRGSLCVRSVKVGRRPAHQEGRGAADGLWRGNGMEMRFWEGWRARGATGVNEPWQRCSAARDAFSNVIIVSQPGDKHISRTAVVRAAPSAGAALAQSQTLRGASGASARTATAKWEYRGGIQRELP
ncbi:unnamed protein product [Gadus morhua 'NCC']